MLRREKTIIEKIVLTPAGWFIIILIILFLLAASGKGKTPEQLGNQFSYSQTR